MLCDIIKVSVVGGRHRGGREVQDGRDIHILMADSC